MRGELIETFKSINGFASYGHNKFRKNTPYQTCNLQVPLHHPSRVAHDLYHGSYQILAPFTITFATLNKAGLEHLGC